MRRCNVIRLGVLTMFNVPMMTLPTSGQPCRSWIFVVVMLFSLMSARRAVLGSFVGAVLFLPQAGITLPGLPDITKISVTSFSVLLAVALFDTTRLLRFRLSWLDLPMLAWCLAPLPSSIVNGLSAL